MSESRLDKWLFHARFYRTRPLAQRRGPAPEAQKLYEMLE